MGLRGVFFVVEGQGDEVAAEFVMGEGMVWRWPVVADVVCVKRVLFGLVMVVGGDSEIVVVRVAAIRGGVDRATAVAAVAVCNDSGLAHLAAAVGAPTVAIFGSTSSAWTAPLGPRVRIVQRAPVCSPCFQRTCRVGTRCLTAIAVADVERACREVAA